MSNAMILWILWSLIIFLIIFEKDIRKLIKRQITVNLHLQNQNNLMLQHVGGGMSDSKHYFNEYKKVRNSLDLMVKLGDGDSKDAHKVRSILIDYWNKMKPEDQKEIAKIYI
jgi:hypothetical protein